MAKVSVVIPVYNVERYLRICLASVLGQVGCELEVICVDDGSTDGSGRILDEAAGRDVRLSVIHQTNAGAGPARNAGLDRMTGEFVAFMDPDDFYPDGHVLRRLVDAAVRSGCAIVQGRHVRVDERGREIDLPRGVVTVPYPPPGECRYRDYQVPSGFTYCLYRADLLRTGGIRFPAFRRFEDPLFFVRAMLAADTFLQISENVYCYRVAHKKVDWKADGGRLEKERRAGYDATVRFARENGLERLEDLIARRMGARRVSWVGRLAIRLCAIGSWVRPVPFACELELFFDAYAGRPFDETLFAMIQRTLTAPAALRRPLTNVLARRLAEARREGRLSLRSFRRCRRVLLLGLLAVGWCRRLGRSTEERR